MEKGRESEQGEKKVTEWETSEMASTDLEIRLEAHDVELPQELPREIWQTP